MLIKFYGEDKNGYRAISVDKIAAGTNCRNEKDDDLQELARSIELNGLLHPIVVRPTRDGRYEIIAGHRRYEAYKLLGEPFIECSVIHATDREYDILQVSENIQRKVMSAYELVETFERLKKKYHYDNNGIAQLFNKSYAWVTLQYSAKNQLEAYYKTGNIPAEEKKKSAGVIFKEKKQRQQEAPEITLCKGFTVKRTGHHYTLIFTELHQEQEFYNFIKERTIAEEKK